MDRIEKVALGVLALTAALTAGAALSKADGLPYSVKDTPYATGRTVSCYVKAFGAGNFVNTKADMGGMVLDSLGSKDIGVGGQVGCDVASSLFLAGLFADYTWHNANFNATVAGVPAISVPFKNEGSVGARLGVMASANTLMYGLVAYTVAQKDDPSMMGISLGLNGPKGVALGGGIEVGLTKNITATLEYRHTGFDTQTATIIPSKFDTTEDTVRVGIGYRF